MTPRALIRTALLMAAIAAVGVVVMDRALAAEPEIPGVSLVGNGRNHALRETRDRQVARLRFSEVHQGCAGDQPQDRQHCDPFVAPALTSSATPPEKPASPFSMPEGSR